jgi:serine protease Do
MNKSRTWCWVLLALWLTAPLYAQDLPQRAEGEITPRESLLVPAVLAEHLEPLFRRTTVRLEDEKGELLGLATAWGTNGFLVAKAGDHLTTSNLLARAFGGRPVPARRAGYDAANDLLLLKANLRGLGGPPASPGEPAIGDFLFSVEGEKRLTLRGGIVSARARPVEKREGYMGIRMADRRSGEAGVRIFDVLAGSGAEEAGLRPNDVLLTVEGTPVDNQEEVRAIVFKHDPGEALNVRFRRGEEEVDAKVRLKHASTLNGDLFDRNQLMSGETSRRKTGFTRVLQHELTLNRRAMGGPLLDTEGRLVGLNISRVNRVEVYALPWPVVEASVRTLLDAHRAAGARVP